MIISPRLTRKVSDAARRFLRTPTDSPVTGTPTGGPAYFGKVPVAVVKVTGSPTGSLYPADIESFSAGGGTWSGTGSVWAVGLNGETLTNGTRYEGRAVAINTDHKLIFGVTVPGTGGGGGTTIVTKDKVGTVIDSACTTIQMDAAGVLTLSAAAGTDTFTVTAAGASQAGVVSTTTQTFAGNKTFNNSITAQATGVSQIIGCATLVNDTIPYLRLKVSSELRFQNGFDDAAVFVHAGSGPGSTTLFLKLHSTIDDSLQKTIAFNGSGIAVDGNQGVSGTSQSGDTVTGGVVTTLATDGATGSIGYNKSGGGTGTITVTNGRITAFT